jgi:putative restriction endonuclease
MRRGGVHGGHGDRRPRRDPISESGILYVARLPRRFKVSYKHGMAPEDRDARVRQAMFVHLDRVSAAHPDGIPSQVINSFAFEGRPMRLIVQPGIRKPAELTAALTIRTAYTPPGGQVPYEDELDAGGVLRYKWRGTDPRHADNQALREAMHRRVPLAYFYPIAKGVYEAIYPVYLVAEDPFRHEFAVEFAEHLDEVDPFGTTAERRYSRQLTLRRLHQIVFRPMVLRAYECQCTLCRLRHAPLLDAAHILPDRHARGDPVVQNGMTLCKIHHAAYDANIIGIRPDYVVEVRHEVLTEIDGPMLRHGLQEMHGSRLLLPRSRHDHPDPSRLEERWEEFRAA